MAFTPSDLEKRYKLHQTGKVTPQTGVFELADYLRIVWQRKWTIVVITLLAVAAAAVWSSNWVPLYRSSAQVLIEVGQGTFEGSTGFVNLTTEAQIASSEEVADTAAEDLDFEGSLDAIRSGLSVAPESDSEILTFSYTALRPEVAQARAQAFAEAYTEFRQRELLERALAAQEPIRNAIAEKEQELNDAQEELGSTDDPAIQADLQREIDSLSSDIDFLEQQQLLQAPTPAEFGTVIEDARVPLAPIGTGRLRTIALALIAGVALGIGIVFLRERLDESLRSREDLEAHVSAPVLAIVPKVRNWRNRNDAYLVTVEEFDSAASEAYRTLRIGLMFASTVPGSSVFLITSAEAGEGKSTTTANLGVAHAAAGKRVIVVSADLRRPRLDAFLRTRSSQGLTNVLAGEVDLEKALRTVKGAPNLRLLPSGPIPGNPAELLSSYAMVELIARLREQSDVVLMDAAPVLAVSDAIALSARVDGVLLVADANTSRRRSIAQAARMLRQVNANIVGAVLGNASGTRWGYDSRHYHSYGPSAPDSAGNGANWKMPVKSRSRFSR